MDGLLVIDKPSGPTSHDVVARLRRVLRETRIGHTGTLDPMATGVLLLVVGRATRLAKFLSVSDKSYEAVVRFGFATDTADAQGRPLGAVSERPMPSREAIEAALDEFRGTFMQQPPAFSAKKIDGQRSYKLARKRGRESIAVFAPGDPQDPQPSGEQKLQSTPDPALPAPASVTTTRLEIVGIEADCVTLQVDCSAGFYVRSLAHDLGERLGVGAHLTSLRRTRTGDFGLDHALSLEAAERDPRSAVAALVPLSDVLPSWPSVVLTADGASRVAHGQDIRPIDRCELPTPSLQALFVKLLNAQGDLLAIAEPAASGLLHPSVVLV